eukprot:m.12823 g.12823  ORF g.12823 m.12823 type:complete len:390 (+) comp4736_c0_seq1:128-1297(+)
MAEAKPEEVEDVLSIFNTLGLGGPAVPGPQSESTETLVAFANDCASSAKEWAEIFKSIPADHEKRKAALAAAIKVRSAEKKFLKIAEEATKEGEQKTEDKVALLSCQETLKDCIEGLLEMSFPADEALVNSGFQDTAGVDIAMDRLDSAAAKVSKLQLLFNNAGVDPSLTAEGAKQQNDLPPEVMKMLEDAMKKKDAKKKEITTKPGITKENVKKSWESEDGRMSTVVSETLWESLCWQRGAFQHVYIASKFNKLDEDATEAPLPALLLDRAIKNLHHMLHAQGPPLSDFDDPKTWTLRTAKQNDETSLLFHHGIYSSTHLLALKYLVELCYWRWKYFPEDGSRDKWAAIASRLLKKFVHVVSDIIPASKWTAEIEKERLADIKASTKK